MKETLAMAKSGAERQRELRARRHHSRVGSVPDRDRGEGEVRLDIWVRTSAWLALKKLAERRGASQRETLEAILMETYEAVTV